MIHPRVCNVRKVPRIAWDIYCGRTVIGVTLPGEREPARLADAGWGNPFSVSRHGKGAMVRYLDWLQHDAAGRAVAERARRELPGKRLSCWCAPGPCHAVVLARLADGERLDVIRQDVLAALGIEDGPEQTEMFPAPAGVGDEA